ncbi:PrsW family intramembrane metalloprotease [Halomicrobium sp. LC1Hm]|uniref:PrsW family intramembrane metalloprotease n=1 Tax=Halomicrobium sp. LC1Hm TaxID=2610902 RepID=UPI001298411F|nr:PrsW family glutamic-type intramembrane protease [Halomicrobium sp. LC1Hm]QGA83536.1 Membrane proteinase of CAAX superfamily, regulator of anti-sigma factor [Halomicrobium sp. LC1Hm]
MPDRDPVQDGLPGEDLYDVAEWDARSWLDRFSVALYGLLHTSRRWALLVVALFLFVVQLGFAGLLVVREPNLGVLALLSAVPAIALVAYVWYGDPTRREPIDTLAITFVLAVVFAAIAALVNTLLSGVFELIPIVGTALFFFLVVGPIEETVKWLAIRTYAYETESFDAVVDGAVYGAVAGLGFATIENALYIAQGYLQAADLSQMAQLQQAIGTSLSRALVGPGHVLYSAFAGYYLGLAKFNPDDRGPIVVKGIVVAALIHGAYNTLVSVLPSVLSFWNVLTLLAFVVVFDGVVGYALYRKLSRYRSYYARASEATDAATETADDPAEP